MMGQVLTTRREVVAAAAGLAVAGTAATTRANAALIASTRRVGPGEFLDGVASGEPTSEAITFWGRLETERPRSAAKLIVAKDEGLKKVVATALVPTSAGVDHTLKARIANLEPDTRYWYAWQSRDSLSPLGRTKTVPPPSSDAPVNIGFSSCQRFPDGFFNAHADAAAHDDLDLYAFLGDYTYEYDDSEANSGDGPSTDLTSYRSKLRFYRADPHLRELHRLHPVVHVWDDHEVADNYTDGDPAPSDLQHVSGYRASFEWMPRLSVPGDRYRLYRNWRIGRHAELFMLDERQYRDPGTPGTTMLGRPQMDWVKAGLAASGASWKLVGNPVMIGLLGANVPGLPIPVNTDQWDGYPAERAELLGHIASQGIDDVCFLTGDIHLFMAGHLSADGNPLAASVATEYVGGSITSSGLPAAIDGLTGAVIMTANPQIRYVEGSEHGWARARLDGSELRVEYRSSDITTRGAPVRTLASFVQRRGENRFEQVEGVRGGRSSRVLGDDPARRPAPEGSPLADRRRASAKIAGARSDAHAERVAFKAARRATRRATRGGGR